MSARRGGWVFVALLFALGTAALLAAFRLRHLSMTGSSAVLIFDVPRELEESEAPFRPLSFEVVPRTQPTTYRVVDGLRRAARDSRIEALVLQIDQIDWGWAKVSEVRDAVLAFRAAGKPVYAWLSSGGEAEYLLASAAGTIAMPPSATLQLDGLTASALFLKGTFEKLSITPNFAHAGRYKSAVEQYTRSEMSEPSRAAMEALLDDEYRLLVDSLASARGLPPGAVRRLLDNGPYGAGAAYRQGLVDTLLYAAELDSLALRGVGESAVTQPFWRYLQGLSARGRARIALVQASGTIYPGRSRFVAGEGRVLGSETLIEALHEARTRRSIRAIVLRIDSPGGSLEASDEIWREVERCRRAKPVVVSMSDLAASGGYYIAAGASEIVAQPATLTGSIGVFGGKLNVLGLYRKLGMNVETLKRGRHAEMMSPYENFTPDEEQRFQGQLEDGYRLFLRRVSAGRHMPVAVADSVGQGRVWSGLSARGLGLVDRLGNLWAALGAARERAGIPEDEELAVEVLPKVEHSFFERALADWLQEDDGDNARAVSLPPVVGALLAAARFPAGASLALMPYRVVIR